MGSSKMMTRGAEACWEVEPVSREAAIWTIWRRPGARVPRRAADRRAAPLALARPARRPPFERGRGISTGRSCERPQRLNLLPLENVDATDLCLSR